MDKKVIITESLTKHYGKVVGVEKLALEVFEGELFGYLGPNGAGKTTTLRLLMGMLRPDGGTATVLGLDAWKDSVAVNAEVGYLPGDAPLYESMTGEGHIRFIAGFNDHGEKEGLRLAERLGLELDRKVSGFSRGMKQKLALILALMKKPPLLLMDEPTSGLDPLVQQTVYEILNEYREDGSTVLFSSHNLPEVEKICDRVGVIREGHLAGTERIEDLRNKRLRNVEIIFSGGVPEDLGELPGVTDLERAGNRVQLKLKGEIDPLIKMVARYKVADFSVSHASLEDVFLEFYGRGKGGDGS
ncbi:MAG: ABC transporter ATP-binding protein [Actinobacteria bacterium]|nr:ABC transporter ATP-binding protein [Actinomycetota bacterium]MCG2818684.1 ABC transporter ATP-binding protein [Actinomycetes bacterium]MBU4178842.1 ABC transporter ATP-binding protein [Actinomycetota bacterium]MBU4218126.1 ABC transporter ATP-binding protein [Actinomycetota bacterium]MBU4358551.1 ABC transporter ATP-binding protein [Actinomycetota bacterium]